MLGHSITEVTSHGGFLVPSFVNLKYFSIYLLFLYFEVDFFKVGTSFVLPLVLHYCSLFFLYCRFSGAVDRLSIVTGSGHCVEPFIIAHSYIFVYQAGVYR